MSQLFLIYLQNSIQLSFIVLIILFITPLLSKRYSAKCRYYLWFIVSLAFNLPVRGKITLELPAFLHTMLPQNEVDYVSGSAVITESAKVLTWYDYAGIIWVIGILCLLCWNFLQHLFFLSGISRWSEKVEDTAVQELFCMIKAELGIKRKVLLKYCACISTPMVVGLFHPTVLLPHTNVSISELPLILKHELMHYKRKDLWYKVFIILTLSIHWFNPVVHLMVNVILNLCEISCDEEVLKGIGVNHRVKYGESIIGTVRNCNAYRTALSSNFYSGIKGMKKRIYAIMDMSVKRFSPALYIIVLMASICGTTSFDSSSEGSKIGVQNRDQTSIVDTIKDLNQLPISESVLNDANKAAQSVIEQNEQNEFKIQSLDNNNFDQKDNLDDSSIPKNEIELQMKDSGVPENGINDDNQLSEQENQGVESIDLSQSPILEENSLPVDENIGKLIEGTPDK